ncbi:MAG: hypothetical protein P4L95_08775 [Rouxiella aceris]|uniref:hypothetical protein n=1 Tax=Rouxiella aceris TaxID=2703884 RepID=UPI0028424872|nr:hypothetical protein [Rouxiella aceris]MDR3431977.1 hypothetical protein [Rouxiella aceris]
MTKNALLPEEQIIHLNRYLIDNASQLPSPVITVGGQAVVYWLTAYIDSYPERPEMTYITSQDVDYVAKKENVEIIANIFNVEGKVQEVFNPPSIAVLTLIDKDTGKIKEIAKGVFSGESFNDPNLVDIIDRPTGFDASDFMGEKLLLNTEPFLVMPDQHGAEMSHDFVRVLNPIATIRSRLSNATVPMGKDKRSESERLKIMALPAYNFLVDKLQRLPFREARVYVDYFYEVIWQRQFRYFLVEYNIPLYVILVHLVAELNQSVDDYDHIPAQFYRNELPRKAAFFESEFERYRKLVGVSDRSEE